MEKEYRTGITPDALKGTKTEQNLHTALSGESQAYIRYKLFESRQSRTDSLRYLRYSAKLQKTKRNTLKSGSDILAAGTQPRKIWKLPQAVNTLNGTLCTLNLQRKRVTRALVSWPLSSSALLLSKSVTKKDMSVTAKKFSTEKHSPPILKIPSGYASTADTLSKAKLPLLCVLPVSILKAILKSFVNSSNT